MVKNRSTLWYGALIVGWAFDILYWKKPPGISFFIHLVLLLGVLGYLAWKEQDPAQNQQSASGADHPDLQFAGFRA